jgi:hypothetical protein
MFTTPRLLRKGLFIALVALTTSGLASAQATAGQKAAPANQKQAAASGKGEQKFLCTSPSFKEDHYFVNVDAKTVRTDSVVRGGPNGQDAWAMKDVSITEDAISFTQKIDFGGVVLVRKVGINRKDGSFTNNGKTEGKCVVVDKFEAGK